MAEHIERGKVLKIINFWKCRGEYGPYGQERSWSEALEQIECDVEDILPADVAHVAHGKWLKPEHEYHVGICSLCGCAPLKPAFRATPYNYCPNCGAKMDEEV